jgi:hypothetical protein
MTTRKWTLYCKSARLRVQPGNGMVVRSTAMKGYGVLLVKSKAGKKATSERSGRRECSQSD